MKLTYNNKFIVVKQVFGVIQAINLHVEIDTYMNMFQ